MRFAAFIALFLAFTASPLLAAPGPSTTASAAPVGSAALLDVPDAELPPLPKLAPIARPDADPEARKELEQILARVLSEKKDIREAARAQIKDAPASLVPAVRDRVQEIRQSLDRDRAPRLLADSRKEAAAKRKSKKAAEATDEDWLEFVLDDRHAQDDAWRDLAELLAMVRVLGAIGTTPAVRELIELRANFGELLRIDLSRQIALLKDRAVPALIEAKKHDATIVQRFAEVELDRLGKVTPGEAVSMSDVDVLSDTLRAFGHVRNEEAVDALLSFANHERKKVRDAARESIAAIGEPGRWRLRDAYQDLTGEKVDKSIPWDVLARRIFAIYDKGRVAELWGIFSAGLEASTAGKHGDAVAAFDKVLARDPLFDRRKEMAMSYFELGKTLPFDRAEERLATLRKSRRLDPEASDISRVDAEIAYTEAKVLIAEGRPDRFLLERAVDLDPNHTDAKQLLVTFDKAAVKEEAVAPRYGIAGAIAGITVLLLGIVGFFTLRKKNPGPGSTPRRGGAEAQRPEQKG